MKKILLLIALILCLCLIVSCKKSDSGTKTPGTDSSVNGDESGFDNEGKIALILSDEFSEDFTEELYYSFVYELEIDAVLTNSQASNFNREITIGRVDRELSKRAYTLLSRIEKEDEDFDTSYLILSDGNSVAVAFDTTLESDLAKNKALDILMNEILSGNPNMVLESGVLKEETLNILNSLDEEDDAKVAEALDALYVILGGDELAQSTLEEIIKFRSFASDELIRWLANLYDPETGGFYYSNSGRNTIGYAPDIESTEQALNLLSSSGALSAIGYSPANLPSWMKEALVNWIKPMQDTNGYFYHPQWGKELTDSRFARRGRDLWRAENILNWCGAKPTYNTPNGTQGDYTLIDGTRVDAAGTPVSKAGLTERLGASAAYAVSKISTLKLTAGTYPSHMKDEATFLAYLNSFDIKHDSYYAGNEIASQAKEIANRETQLKAEGSSWSIKATLEKWLNESQNPENGLWYYVAEGSEKYSIYDGVNGLLKISALYNEVGIEFPNPIEAIESAIKGIYTDEDPLTVCYTYNTWFSVLNIFKNLETFSTNPEETEKTIAQIRGELLEDAPNAIRITREKVAKFLKDDGSFSYYQQRTSHGSMGMPVAVPNVNEGDVNATLICAISTAGYMYQVLGIEEYMPSLYGRSTWYEFLNIIDDIGDVIKNEIKDDPTLAFDDYDLGQTPDEVFYDYNYSSGSITVVNDELHGKKGKVLKFESPADGGDRIQIDCTNPLSTNSYVFETEMCVESGRSSGYCVQIVMGDCYMLALRIVGDRVQIFDTSSASTIKKEVEFGYSVALDEWFKLRMEYYVGDHDTVRAKVYVNDKLIAVSDNYYNHSGSKITTGSATPATVFTFVRISAFSNYNVSLLFDNMSVYKRNDIYEVETDTLNQPVYTVDPPTLEEKTFDFDSLNEGKNYPLGFEVDKGGDEIEIRAEGENKLLYLLGTSSDGFKLTVPHYVRVPEANCDLFEADITLKSAEQGAKFALEFRSADYTESSVIRLLFTVIEEAGVTYLVPHSYADGFEGAALEGIKIPISQTVKFKMEYYSDAKSALIFINGSLAAFADGVCAGADSYEIGKLDIKSLGSGAFALALDNVKLYREVRDFGEASAPTVDRVVHDFTNDALSGVEITEGAIDSGVLNLYENGRITLPLNKRSVAINAILLSLDISSAEGSDSYIRIENESGETVLSYLIRTEGGTTTLREVTKNSSYGNIAVFSANDMHTLAFEYFRSAGQVNIYLDGECVMISRLTYSPDTAATLPVTAVIEGEGLKLDDIVFEGYAKLCEDPEIKTDISADGTADFEADGKGALHSSVSITDFTSYSVKEALRGSSYTKILEFITTRGKKDSFALSLTSKKEGYASTAFETKIYVRHDGGSSSYAFTVKMQDENGEDAYKFVFRIGDAGMQMWDIAYENGETKVIAPRDSWFTLRVEYHHESGKVITLVNGVEVYNSTNLCAPVAEVISRVRFEADEGLNATVLLDDMSLVQSDGQETPEKPEEPETPTEPEKPETDINPDTEGLENAEDNAAKITFEYSENANFPNSLVMRLANASSSIAIEELVRAEDNRKVMVFKTVKGNKDSVKLTLTEGASEYNATVFETDLYIQHDGGSSSYAYTVALTDTNGNAVYKFVLRIGDAGMQMYDIASVTGTSKVIAARDSWFTLRVEYIRTADGVKVMTYVNGELKYESDNVISSEDIVAVSLTPDEGLNATTKLDNMSLSKRTVEITEEEVVPEEAGPILGFENGAISSKVTPTLESGTLKVEEYKDHKAMVLSTADGSYDRIKISHTANKVEGYNVTVFEADLLLYHVGPSSAYNENVYLVDKDGNEVYRFTLRHADAGVYMQAIGENGAVIAQRWVWFSFRLEYHHSAEGDFVNVYVGDTLKYESILSKSVDEIGGVVVSPDKGIASKLYIDNLALYTEKEEN